MPSYSNYSTAGIYMYSMTGSFLPLLGLPTHQNNNGNSKRQKQNNTPQESRSPRVFLGLPTYEDKEANCIERAYLLRCCEASNDDDIVIGYVVFNFQFDDVCGWAIFEICALKMTDERLLPRKCHGKLCRRSCADLR